MSEPTERWRAVAGWAGYYEVSDLGRVRSVNRTFTRSDGKVKTFQGKVLKPYVGDRGYESVTLCRQSRPAGYLVHVLVAVAFIGPCPAGQEVRHGPGGKLDNRASELCYGTRSQNVRDRTRDGQDNRGERSGHAKLTREAVSDIRARVAAGESHRVLAREYCVTFQNISMVVRRKTWAHV